MIQRVQSIFLLMASGGFWSLFVLPFSKSSTSTAAGTTYENMTMDIQDHTGLLGLAIAGGLFALVAIFFFNNRSLQKTMAWLTLILSIALGGLAAWFYNATGSVLSESNDVALNLGFAMPVLSGIMALLAGVFIGKDDKLVKSMDRLR